jgi:hypothetical protein
MERHQPIAREKSVEHGELAFAPEEARLRRLEIALGRTPSPLLPHEKKYRPLIAFNGH